MNIVFYIPVRDRRAKRIQEIVEVASLEAESQVFATIKMLAKGIFQPHYPVKMAVLYAPRKKDLQDLLTIRDLLRKVHIILMLPERKESTISRGHILRPGFLTFVYSDLADVGLLLTKMMKTFGKKAGAGH